MKAAISIALVLSWMAPGACAQSPVALVVTADAGDYLLAETWREIVAAAERIIG